MNKVHNIDGVAVVEKQGAARPFKVRKSGALKESSFKTLAAAVAAVKASHREAMDYARSLNAAKGE